MIPRLPLALAWMLLAGLAVEAAAAATVAPHQATYRLTFRSMTLPGSVTSAEGVMSSKLEATCDGWTSHVQMAFRLQTSEGGRVDLQSAQANWESRDGLGFRFFSQTNLNGSTVQRVEGRARLQRPGGGGEAVYTKPGRKAVALPAGTLFPIHATLYTLDTLRGGALQVQTTVFDGATAPGPYLSSDMVVGAPVPPRTQPRGDTALLEGRLWRVRSAYFDPRNRDGTPFGESTAQVYENFVVGQMILDFKQFSATAELTEIKALPAPSC